MGISVIADKEGSAYWQNGIVIENGGAKKVVALRNHLKDQQQSA